MDLFTKHLWGAERVHELSTRSQASQESGQPDSQASQESCQPGVTPAVIASQESRQPDSQASQESGHDPLNLFTKHLQGAKSLDSKR